MHSCLSLFPFACEGREAHAHKLISLGNAHKLTDSSLVALPEQERVALILIFVGVEHTFDGVDKSRHVFRRFRLVCSETQELRLAPENVGPAQELAEQVSSIDEERVLVFFVLPWHEVRDDRKLCYVVQAGLEIMGREQ